MMLAPFIANIRISVNELATNKLRAFLTVLGITIGIAAVVLLLSLGQSVQNYVTDQFEGLGTNILRISSQLANGRNEPLTLDLVDALADPDRVSGVDTVLPEVSGSYAVTYENNQFTVTITGATLDYPNVENRSVDNGRFFTRDEFDQSAQTAVIGTDTSDNLFGEGVDPVGKTIRIANVLFEVTGVLDESGTSDDLIVVPFTAFKARLNNTRSTTGEYTVNMILVKVSDVSQIDTIQDRVEAVLREERGISADDTDNFRVFTASTIVESLMSTIQILTLFLGVVAGISLLVGGINVMNIMLVTITERTREIGLRKATGAQYFDIVLLFLTQAIILTLLGGIAGITIAAAGSALISSLVNGLTVIVQAANIILAVSISTAIGLFFGVYPATRAAKLNPIDALRYE